MWATKFTGVGHKGNNRSVSAGGEAYIANVGDAQLPRHLAILAGKLLRALTHARGAARAAATLDRGAMIPIGSL